MRKLIYMGLESYEGRYTLQFQDWSERAFKKRGIELFPVKKSTTPNRSRLVRYLTHMVDHFTVCHR